MTDTEFNAQVADGLRASLAKLDEMIVALPERRAELRCQRKGIERKLARLERKIDKTEAGGKGGGKAKGVPA